jgi:hypothetical protein
MWLRVSCSVLISAIFVMAQGVQNPALTGESVHSIPPPASACGLFSANGPVFASPISYLSNGKQMVSIPAGDLIVTFGLD